MYEQMLSRQIEWGIILLFTAVMMSYLTFVFLNSKHSRMRTYYCLMHNVIILIVVVDYIISVIPDAKIKMIILTFLGLMKLFFDSLFVFYGSKWLKKNTKLILRILTIAYVVCTTVLILTNPIHQLYAFFLTESSITYGCLYYITMCIGMCIELAGIIFLAYFWVKQLENRVYRAVATLISILAIVFNHFYLMKIFTEPVNIYPVLILLCFTFFLFGALKYSMFDAITLTSMYGLEMFTDSIVITDKKGNVIYKNKTGEQLNESLLQQILKRIPASSKNNISDKESSEEIDLPYEDTVRFFTVTIKKIKRDVLSKPRLIYIIHDNTENVMAINTLAEKNQYLQEMYDSVRFMADDEKKLAVLKERNMLAQDIHDVVGHSLILVLNTMESNKLLSDDRSYAMSRIRQAITEIDKNITDSRETEAFLLSEKLMSLTERLSKDGITLQINGCEVADVFSKQVLQHLLRVCQESVTNAIKHGKADHITITFKRKNDSIEIYIIDNGKGCENIVRGTGLSGMEKRIRSVNGSIVFSSFEDQTGFMVRVGIPYKQ